MPDGQVQIPLVTREASVRAVRAADGNTIEVVWSTGASVQRRRWEGWDDLVEYDEELVVAPGAVRLERLNSGLAPFLDSHNAWSLEAVLGSVVAGSARIEGGLGIAGIRLTGAPDAAPAVARIMEGTVAAVSVGYRVHRYEIVKADGQRELWRAVDWEPLEISAVPIGADPGARVRSDGPGAAERLHPCILVRREPTAAPAATRKETTMDGQQTTAAPAESADRETRSAAAAAPAPAPAAGPVAAQVEAARAEERRTAAEVLSLCARHGLPQTFSSGLIARGLSLDAARAAILDELASRDDAGGSTQEAAPARARGDGAEDRRYGEAVASALLHRYDPARNPLAEGAREFRGLQLIELARSVLERNGLSTRGMARMEVAREALLARSLHSTSDFPFILANVAGKVLRTAYEGTQRTFTAWARRSVVTDFKQVSRVQLGGAPNLELVPEGAEVSYGTMGESREVYALLTYARIVGITRQVIVNDDLDAFTRIPAAFGAAAADLESDIVYSILTSNPNMADALPLFDVSRGNLGTAGIISETSLAEAYRRFGNQRGLEGRQISVLPRYIIVPPGVRSVEARKNVTAVTPNAVAGVNAFAGRLEVVEEPRLMGAPDPWFLAADPARIDTVEYAYLEGQEGVYVETRQGFEVDGVEVKARLDFAAKAIDGRGLFRNAGV